MINIVLYNPEIPQNTGNIMRTCVATGSILHLIKPYGFILNDSTIKRSGVNYIDKLEYHEYDDWEEFKSKNKGTYYYFTRYGHKHHTSFDYSDSNENIYLIFGKESTGIPREILKDDLEHCMRIPMTINVRSLNLSNCAAIMLFLASESLENAAVISHEPDTMKGEFFIDQIDVNTLDNKHREHYGGIKNGFTTFNKTKLCRICKN